MEYLKTHLSERLTAASIATACSMSEGTLKSLCHEFCSCSPIDYLIFLRIAAAKRLIRNSSLSFTEIAEETGISRQGVWDIIKRAEETLRKTEEKTGLIRRFREHLEAVAEMEQILAKLTEQTDGEARVLTEQLSESLNKLKG